MTMSWLNRFKRGHLMAITGFGGIIYCFGAFYNYKINHDFADAITLFSFGFALLIFTLSLNNDEITDERNVDLNNKLDKIISYYTSKEEIINQARQNKELYDLNLIDFDEYELNRLELKNRLKESND